MEGRECAAPGARDRARVIEAHLGLVHRIAAQYAGRGERREDLVQIGSLALVVAVDRCDPRRAELLPAYVARCVEGEILRHLRDRSAGVRVPRRLQEAEVRTRRIAAGLARELGREPTTRELALGADMAESDVRAARDVESARRPLPLVESDSGAADDVELVGLDRALVARAARALDNEERRVVLLRYFLDLSQDEIAAEIGMSQAHVSRLLARAARKMQRRLER